MPARNTSKNYPFTAPQNVTTTIFSIQQEFGLHISMEINRKTFVSVVTFSFHHFKVFFFKPFHHTDTTMYLLVTAAKCRIFVCVLVM